MSGQLPSDAPCWPTPDRKLLLEAGLCDSQRALAAWREWSHRTDLDDVEGHIHQLLPLVFRNLAEAAAGEPDWPRIRGIYRRNWANNQLLFAEAEELIGALRAEGLPCLVLKGMALARLYYPDVGCRPMVDVDILVPAEGAGRAVELLNERGWTCPAGSPKEVLEVRHSAPFHGGREGSNIDLHWGVLWQPADGEGFWERSRGLPLGGGGALALSPTDQLLHVLVHGTYWSVISYRWVADAIMVMRSSEVDWRLFVGVARDHDLTWGLADMLSYLRDGFAAEVDPEAITELRATPVSRRSRLGREAMASAPTYASVLRAHWARYRAITNQAHRVPTPWGFATYLRLTWREPSYTRLAARGVRRAVHGPSWNRAVQR
jgi:Uncharacterised nucleotidyltransferase